MYSLTIKSLYVHLGLRLYLNGILIGFVATASVYKYSRKFYFNVFITS